MTRKQLGRALDELANALQVAVGLADTLRRQTQTTANDTIAIEAAITRAALAIKRLQPRHRGRS